MKKLDEVPEGLNVSENDAVIDITGTNVNENNIFDLTSDGKYANFISTENGQYVVMHKDVVIK